jgi:hypothetical protein
VNSLRGSHQVFTELVAEVNVDFIEAALVVTESDEVLIDVLPLAVLLVCLLLEVGKEVTLHLFFVKEIIAFIDDGLIATTAEGFSLLAHTVVIVLLSLRLRLGINVDTERFMTHDLHGGLIPITWVVVEIEG